MSLTKEAGLFYMLTIISPEKESGGYNSVFLPELHLSFRLNDQTEVAEKNIKKLRSRTESRLAELSALEVSVKQTEDNHYLLMVEKLRDAWPTVADDESTLKQLEALQEKVNALECL